MNRHRLPSALCVATLCLALGACSETPDCESRIPSVGIWFSLSGFSAEQVDRLELEVHLGKEPQPKLFTINKAELGEVFIGSTDRGQLTLILGQTAQEAAFAREQQLTVIALRAFAADGSQLGTTDDPDKPQLQALKMNGCNFIEGLVIRGGGGGDGGGDSGSDGGPSGVWELETKPAPLQLVGPSRNAAPIAPGPAVVCNFIGPRDAPNAANDLIVGYPTAEGQAGGVDHGRVYVLAGPGFGDKLSGRKEVDEPSLGALRLFGSVKGGRFGEQLHCADLDGDDHHDLIVAAPGANHGVGEVYVFFGRDVRADGEAQDADVRFTLPPTGSKPTELGAALTTVGGWDSAGSLPSLAIGAPGFRDEWGAVFTVLSSTSWLDSSAWPLELDLQGYYWRERPAVQVTRPPSDDSAEIGTALAISADGNTLIVGAPAVDGYKGAAVVLSYDTGPGFWSGPFELTSPLARGAARFGEAVAISPDGLTVLVGEPGADAAYVFRRAGMSWPLAQSLTGAPGSRFGHAVALSDSRAVVGAPDTVTGSRSPKTTGAAYVFDGTDWQASALPSEMLPIPASPAPSTFGAAVAIHDDLVVVGAPETSGKGAAYLYQDLSGWTQADVIMGVATGEQLGAAVAVSKSGATLRFAAGAPMGSGADSGVTGSGVVRINEFQNKVWSSSELLPWDPQGGASFGGALSFRGELLAVGARTATAKGVGEAGALYLFERDADEPRWHQRARLVIPDVQNIAHLGASVAVAKRGGEITALAGAPQVDAGPNGVLGAIFAFAPLSIDIVKWHGISHGSRLGEQLASGAMRGSGADDLFATAPGAVGASGKTQGAVLALAGRSWQGMSEQQLTRLSEHEQHSLALWGVEGTRFGSSLALARIDGDQTPDLLIGAELDGSGRVSLVTGQTNLLAVPAGAAESFDIAAKLKASFVGETQSNDYLGRRLHRTVDGDLLVAAPGWSDDRGTVYLVSPRGAAGYPDQATIEIGPTATTDVQLTVRGADASRQLGSHVSSGDLDGQGRADLLLSDLGAKVLHVILR